MKYLFGLIALAVLASLAFAQQTHFPTDPKTGRAIGAKQMTPEELRSRIDKNNKTLIVDVRDREEFEKETIQGAVNIPLDQVQSWLKDIPKDTTLVFT